jgi:hypothetical protein
MKFNVGQTIRNKRTQQDGCIVRVADTPLGNAYIVSITLDAGWGQTKKEALWTEADVKTTEAEQVRS